MFEFQIPLVTWILLGVEVLAMLLTLLFCLAPMRRIGTASDVSDLSDTSDRTDSPKLVSIIANVMSADFDLDGFVGDILAQDYPNLQLVLVCDAAMEATSIIAEKYAAHENVYVTFIPPGSQNLSRRKLALTLGMKAAKGDIVVTTVANAIIPSESWLRRMVTPFLADSSVDVVLGYSRMDFSEVGGNRRYKEFDSFVTDTQWIGYALGGHPYRGDGRNLALRRKTFFDHKGYARTINLHNGDDDLFISEIATGANTRVVIDADAIPTISWGEAATRIWKARKEAYDFTSRWLPRAPFRRAGMLSCCIWATLGAAIAAALTAIPCIYPAIAALLLLILLFIFAGITYRRAADRLHAHRMTAPLPFFLLWHPIGNFLFRLRHRSERVKNFTWQRHN